ncbi:MAG: hypothetical protein AAGA15_03230 [Pseudomonadota bacterium]
MLRVLPFCVLLTACAEFPELEDTETPAIQEAPYLDFLLAEDVAALSGISNVEATDPLAERLERLRARANRLRGPIFSSGDQSRLSGTAG